MDSRNLEKTAEIFGKLAAGEEIGARSGKNTSLYEEYETNLEVNNMLDIILKTLNLKLYEYGDSIFMTAGDHNRVFGYTNEELKKALGVRFNRELYLFYFIVYHIMVHFYKDSANDTYMEYIRIEDVIQSVNISFHNLLKDADAFTGKEGEEKSFLQLALLWDELPVIINEELGIKASRGSKTGFVKLSFNFLVHQGLLAENEDRYYIQDRMRAIITNYFEEERGRLYEILNREGEEKNAAHKPFEDK